MNEEQKKQEFIEAFSVPAPPADNARNIGPFNRWQILIAFYIIASAILQLQATPDDRSHESEAFFYVTLQLAIIATVFATIIFGGIILLLKNYKIWVRIINDILSFILICIGFFITLLNFLAITASVIIKK